MSRLYPGRPESGSFPGAIPLERPGAGGLDRGMGRQEGVRGYRGAAARIASWTLVSRVLGLIRDRLMFGEFGRGIEAGAFLLAWTVPNLFRRLFGEGALTASFIPVLTRRMEREGEAGGRRCVATIFGALLLVLGLLLVLCLGAARFAPESWLAGGGRGPEAGKAYASLLRPLLYLLLPYLLPVCLMTLAAAAQNVSGRFSLPALAPALLNLFWIGGLLWVGSLDLPPAEKALRLALCLLAGGIAQVLLQFPGLRRSRLLAPPRFDLRDPDLREVARGMMPMMLGLSIAQINVLLSYGVAAYLVPREGANAILFLGNRLLDFPHALLGVALGTAVFPLLSLLGEQGKKEELAARIDEALAGGLFLALPAAAGLAALAPLLVDVLFVHGHFGAEDGRETAGVVRMFAIGLPGLIAVQVLARAHYALGDRRTPVRYALRVLLFTLAGHLLAAPRYGTEGMALISSAAALGNAFLLHLSLRRKGFERSAGTRRALGEALAASVPTAAAAMGTAAWSSGLLSADAGLLLRLPVVLGPPVCAGLGAFYLGTRLLGRRAFPFRPRRPADPGDRRP